MRRERRAILKAREERIRDLGGLTLEMYRRSTFRDDLLIERCREIVALEERLSELDSMLSAIASARRAPTACECGAPVPWGSHFCANCGRQVGEEPVVSCTSCGNALPADAQFCANCGTPVPVGNADGNGQDDAQTMYQQPDQSGDPWEN